MDLLEGFPSALGVWLEVDSQAVSLSVPTVR